MINRNPCLEVKELLVFSSGQCHHTFCFLFPWGLESLHGLHVEQTSHVAIICTQLYCEHFVHYKRSNTGDMTAVNAIYCINHNHPCLMCSLCSASYISFTECTGCLLYSTSETKYLTVTVTVTMT